MSSFLSTLLFASAAAAQITTSIWFPTSDSLDDYDFQASVVGAEGDTVTMAIVDRSSQRASAATLTFHGSTSFENILTATDPSGEYGGDMTVSYGCSKRRGTPVCVASSNGPVIWSAYCEEYSYVTTETFTVDNPPRTVEQVWTNDYLDSMPEFCSTGSLLPESEAVQTLSASDLDGINIGTYAVTITAGEQKLSATAGATPSNTPASSTNSTPSSLSGSPSNSPANSASSGPTPTPTPPAQQSSNAAPAPMKTAAPALVGLGAFVAALM